MKNIKTKSLPLAIGLNFLLVGSGYLYMGKWLVGILAMLLIGGILLTTSINMILPVWLGLNLILALDMWILFRKQQARAIEQSMQQCSHCAEYIQKKAKVCHFCHKPTEAFDEHNA